MIDNFETAIQRNDRTKGYVIAFSFGRGAHEEVARAKTKMGLDIDPVSVEELLNQSHPLAQEPTTLFGATLAAPVKRELDTLPSAEELLGSDPTLARAVEAPAPYGSGPRIQIGALPRGRGALTLGGRRSIIGRR